MKQFDPVAALALPDGALVDRRVPKTLLIENGAHTAADKRRIRQGVEEIRWVAALKPTTVGVAEYRDAAREYLEIAVLKLTFRSGARPGRLTELVHRAVPYPVLLIAWQGDTPAISLAHKRWSQGEAGKTVVEGDIVSTRLGDGCPKKLTVAFYHALAMNRQPTSTLYALYQGWVDTVQALRAGRVTGNFLMPTSQMKAKDRAATLEEYARLESKIAELSASAHKEKQIARQVDVNLELKRLRTNRDAARSRLLTEKTV